MVLYRIRPGLFPIVFIGLITFTVLIAIGEYKPKMLAAPLHKSCCKEKSMKMTDEKIMINIVRDFYRCIDENQSDKIGQLISNEFIDHDAQDVKKGLEELQGLMAALHKGFDSISHELEQVYIFDKDKVFVRWNMTAKHTGSFFNIPPSGKNIILRGHDLFRIIEGKIVEQWHIEQLLSLINQISSRE